MGAYGLLPVYRFHTVFKEDQVLKIIFVYSCAGFYFHGRKVPALFDNEIDFRASGFPIMKHLRLPAIIGIHLVKLGDRPTLKNSTSQGMQTKLLRLPDPEQVAQQSAVIKVQFGGRINQRLFCQPCLSSDAVPVAILTAFGAQGFELDAVLPAWGTGPILAEQRLARCEGTRLFSRRALARLVPASNQRLSRT